jgi:hypothetical protein
MMEHLQNLVNDMDLMMVRHQYVVGNFLCLHLQDVVHLDALQNLDEQIQDAHLPYLDAVRQVAVLVDVELRYLLRTDYFQDVVDVELRYLLRTDYFQDVVLVAELALQMVQ